MIDIEKIKPEIERICRRLSVKRLGLFGSALSQSFSQSSDVDVLVLFDSGENIDLFNKYFELKEQLEKVFKREVDLVVDKKFKNPVLRESIDRTRIVIYERGHNRMASCYKPPADSGGGGERSSGRLRRGML